MSVKSPTPNLRFTQISMFFSSSLLRNAIGLVLGLIITPYILKYLGEEHYGAWLALIDWFGHLGLLEFGLFTALLPVFAKSLASRSGLTPVQVARESFYKYLRVIGYQVLSAVALVFFIDTLIPVQPDLKRDLYLAFIFTTVSMLFGFSNIFRAYLVASHQGHRVSFTMIVQNILITGGAFTAAYLKTGIAGQALAHTIASGLSFAILYTLARKDLSNLFSTKRKPKSFNVLLKKQRGPHFVAQLCGRLSLFTDRLFIAAFLGPVAVTSYFLTQRLINVSMQQIQQIGNSTWAAMSELYYLKKYDQFNRRLIIVTEFISCFTSCGLCVLALFNQSFVNLWVGEKHFMSLELSNIIILNAGLVGINTFWHWCFTGTGLINKILPMLIAQTIVSMTVAFIGSYTIGFYGPPLGTTLSFLLVTQPWTTHLLSKHFHVSPLEITKAWVVPFLLPITVTIGLIEIYGAPIVHSWGGLVLWTLLCLAITFAVFPFILIQKNSRLYLFEKVRSIISKIIPSKEKDG